MIDKISIVDDDQKLTRLLSRTAKKLGYRVTEYSDVECFLNQEHSARELVLLDLCMPEIDGVEVIRTLSRAGCQSRIVVRSGQDKGVIKAAKDLALAQNLSCFDTLSKPIRMASFRNLLQRCCLPEEESQYQKISGWKASKDDLSIALKKREFVLYYQPKIDMTTGCLVGVEALARWLHPVQGVIAPDYFIPKIKELGLINELTTQVIEQAVLTSREWREKGIDVHMAVNVSADTIASLNLPESLARLLAENSLTPSCMKLEITESELMGELVTSLDILTRLRLKGFGLSIDDFGTGYSSLSLLHRVPFSELKIDRSFVANMEKDKEAFAIVETCVMLGHKLNMTVVAEGVETEAQLKLLAGLGCDVAQGYLYSRPLPADELLVWASRQKIVN